MKLFKLPKRFGDGIATKAHHTDIAATPAATVTTSRQVVSNSASAFFGCALAETAGAVAKVRLRDGTSASAPVLITITFSANGSMDTFFAEQGVEITSGAIFLEVVSTGSVEGVVYWA